MFQKQATRYENIPAGSPGNFATVNLNNQTDTGIYSDNQKLLPGDFVMGEVDNATKNIQVIKKVQGNVANKVFLGVVCSTSAYVSNQNPSAGFPNSYPVDYVVKGEVWIKPTADAEAGKFLLIKESDGSQVYDKDPTKAGHMSTYFRVLEGGKKDTLIVIQKV